MNARLKELVVLLPDIVAKLGRVKADLILQLCDTKARTQFSFRHGPACPALA